MNFVDKNSFMTRLTFDKSTKMEMATNLATYKLKCDDFIKLPHTDYTVAVTDLSIAIYSIDQVGAKQCSVHVEHVTATGHSFRAHCIFRNICESNPTQFVAALNQQIAKSPSMEVLFMDNLPFFAYDQKTHQVSLHLGVATAEGRTKMLMSEMLCAKLGFTDGQLPFIGQPGDKPPIVAKSIEPVFLYGGLENVHISLPSLVPHGLLINSTWSSVVAVIPVDYTRLSVPTTFAKQFQQIKKNIVIDHPVYFNISTDEIRCWRLDLLLDNQTILEWIQDVSLSVTLHFKRAPNFNS